MPGFAISFHAAILPKPVHSPTCFSSIMLRPECIKNKVYIKF